MPEKYRVTLTSQERQQLLDTTHQSQVSARRFKRAQILLLADEGHGDEIIAQMLYVGESTWGGDNRVRREGREGFEQNMVKKIGPM